MLPIAVELSQRHKSFSNKVLTPLKEQHKTRGEAEKDASIDVPLSLPREVEGGWRSELPV